MKILHELNQLDYGGVENIVRNIVKYDTDNTHVILAYKDGPFRKELEEAGAVISMPEKDKDADIDDVDVIHIHCGGALSQMAVELGKSFPVVETIHSPVRSPLKDEYVKQRIGVSDAVTRMNSKCKTIYNGIDFDRMKPTRTREEIKKELGLPENIPVIGRLGRIGYDKALEEWLLTCHILQKDVEFIPLIIGPEARNAGGYRGKLKLMAECLPVNNLVWSDAHSDIANYLQAIDVFLYPSPTEGFGLVFAEAMYMGLPVVTYRNPITEEVLGDCAQLCDDSIEALADGTRKALLDREYISKKAWERAVDKFDAKRMAEDYMEVYEEAVK